ncbi:hypothetical protein A9Q93_00960 [Nonlabens dokdonensis]|uniref:Uncharacterized protein n=1 Tax=Nonlabens dokdonensis TaxID=328515 RepID=A0A1Z8BFP7_9FLAO|nr:hypothetical protein [Nonlabens dokdonensis]OUS21402.1 hypothetical protein A9Q93_00960 [Nonlabens dokdonensis]
MKNLILLFFLTYGISLNAVENHSCGCGSFEDSIVHYQVQEGQGCCGTLSSDTALEGFYEQNEGQWELVEVNSISASSAQKRCCP